MLRRTLLKLFTISPLAMLSTFKQIYLIHEGYHHPSTIWVAHPQYYKKRLPLLWAQHRSLVEVMADHCLKVASSGDTRGWTLKQWNYELDVTKTQWQIKRQMRRRNEKKRSA